MNPIKKLININRELKGMRKYIFQTVRFNFHYLPWKQALKLPILLYSPTFRLLSGSVKIDVPDGKLYRGMIKLGIKTIGVSEGKGVVWENDGEVIFHGRCILGGGVKMAIFKTGKVEFGSGICITDNMKLVCGKHIKFCDDVLIGWDATIMDTNQHQLSDPNGNHIGKAYSPIYIGEATWCGFGCTILPGTSVPSRCVVASKSLLNKKYDVNSYSLLAGSPATLKAEGVWRNPLSDFVIYE